MYWGGGLPTLLVHGNLRDPYGRRDVQRRLDQYERPVDYLIELYRRSFGQKGMANKFFVLQAKTASGKSTAHVGETFTHAMRNDHKQMIVTQPRRITSIQNVSQITANYDNIIMDENIGWSVLGNKRRPRARPSILSATVGTLTAKLANMTADEFMSQYRMIMIDEVHERDTETDLTLYLLKRLAKEHADNPEFPTVVVMSATLDADQFLRYFGLGKNNYIYVAGESNEIAEHWQRVQAPSGNLVGSVDSALREIVQNRDEPDKADVLVFLPGSAEIKQAQEKLHSLNCELIKKDRGMSILPIDGRAVSSQSAAYLKAFKEPGSYTEQVEMGGKTVRFKPERRVVLATNVAETGLTLNNLKYVVDSGFDKGNEYNPHYRITVLSKKPASKAKITQRKGRVGRKFAGEYYPLFPPDVHEQLSGSQLPDILMSDVSNTLLYVIRSQIRNGEQPDVGDMDLPSRPSADAVHSAMEKFYALGIISAHVQNSAEAFDDVSNERHFQRTNRIHYGITRIGVMCSKISYVGVESARMILSGYFWGAYLYDLVCIGAYLQYHVIDLNASSKGPNWQVVYQRAGMAKDERDYLAMRLYLSCDFLSAVVLCRALHNVCAGSKKYSTARDNLEEFCEKANLNFNMVMDMIIRRDNLAEELASLGLNPFANHEQSLMDADSENLADVVVRLKYCIYDGFRNNLLINQGGYYNTLGNLIVNVPTLTENAMSSLAGKYDVPLGKHGPPRFIVFDELDAKQKSGEEIYEIRAMHHSAMSGFVNVDSNFI